MPPNSEDALDIMALTSNACVIFVADDGTTIEVNRFDSPLLKATRRDALVRRNWFAITCGRSRLIRSPQPYLGGKRIVVNVARQKGQHHLQAAFAAFLQATPRLARGPHQSPD